MQWLGYEQDLALGLAVMQVVVRRRRLGKWERAVDVRLDLAGAVEREQGLELRPQQIESVEEVQQRFREAGDGNFLYVKQALIRRRAG